jgi:hypothetical protein
MILFGEVFNFSRLTLLIFSSLWTNIRLPISSIRSKTEDKISANVIPNVNFDVVEDGADTATPID